MRTAGNSSPFKMYEYEHENETNKTFCEAIRIEPTSESEYIRSYKLRINALERELSEKKKIIEKLSPPRVTSRKVLEQKDQGAEKKLSVGRIYSSETFKNGSKRTPVKNEEKKSPPNEEYRKSMDEYLLESEFKKANAKVLDLEDLLDSKAETIKKLNAIIESQRIAMTECEVKAKQLEAFRVTEENLKAKNAELEKELKLAESRLVQKEADYKEDMKGYVIDLLKLEEENTNLKQYCQERESLEADFAKAKDHIASLLDELQYYKKRCEDCENDLAYTKEQLEYTSSYNKDQIEEYKRKINEQNELRIRDLLSQNGFLTIQVERLQEELNKITGKVIEDKSISQGPVPQPSRNEITAAPKTVSESPARHYAKDKPFPSDIGLENHRLDIENIELKLKVVSDERELAQQELAKVKEELDMHRISLINTEKECFEKQERITELEKDKDKLLDICATLKEDTKNLEDKIGANETKNALQTKRISDLEEHVRELSKQLEKWVAFATIRKSEYEPYQ